MNGEHALDTVGRMVLMLVSGHVFVALRQQDAISICIDPIPDELFALAQSDQTRAVTRLIEWSVGEPRIHLLVNDDATMSAVRILPDEAETRQDGIYVPADQVSLSELKEACVAVSWRSLTVEGMTLGRMSFSAWAADPDSEQLDSRRPIYIGLGNAGAFQ